MLRMLTRGRQVIHFFEAFVPAVWAVSDHFGQFVEQAHSEFVNHVQFRRQQDDHSRSFCWLPTLCMCAGLIMASNDTCVSLRR